MSEIKRVALCTFEPQKVSDTVNKKTCKTIRISVILPESNEDNCPEYNYKDQLAAVKKRLKQTKEPNLENGLDPFAEDDDDVKRIALEMEAKYGAGMKKKRKGRKDDYADIGMGYDESDSFIDNTDGYDEIIPQNVTTLHGGFYINCGALEFKTDEEASSEISSSSSDSEDDDKGKPTNRKRILESSEETESDTATTSQLEKKPKLQSSRNTMQQAIKKKLFSQNKIQVKKRRPIDPLKKTVKELLREKREDLNMSIPMELKALEQEENAEKDALKENKKPMSISSITDAIESVVKQTAEVDYDDNQNKQNVNVNRKSDLSITKTDALPLMEGESSQEINKTEKVEVVKLPENLPTDILDIINKIKQAALDYKGEGKKKFFTDEVNSMLLSLERKCKILGKSSRIKVYDHLAIFIKCRKETLIRRAKILVLEDEERRLKKLTIKLRDSINQIMPSLMMNFKQESQRILQKKFSKESIDNEENKALKMPRRRFQWSEDTRKLLKDILSIKKRCLLLEGKQKDNLEDQITQYLKAAILPLWPEGWMHINSLKKVYNNMTENSKLSENNNSKNNTSKQHSNLTITPVSSFKTNSSTSSINATNNKSDVQNDVTFNKTNDNEFRPSPKLIEANTVTSSSKVNSSVAPLKAISQLSSSTPTKESEKTKHEREHDYRKTYPGQSSNIFRENEKLKQDMDHGYRKAAIKPNIMQTNNFAREIEKSRHELDHDYKKVIAKPNTGQSSNLVREGEKPNHEKDQDYKKPGIKPNIIAPNASVWEGERSKHEKDHDHKKIIAKPNTGQSSNLVREGEKPNHEKDHDYKKPVIKPNIIAASANVWEGERPSKHEKDHDYKKVIAKPNTGQSSNLVREGEKPNHEKDHDYKKPVLKPNIIAASASVWEGERPKHEKDHDHKKIIAKPNSGQSSNLIREGEKPNHEKDQDYKKPVIKPNIIAASASVWEGERPKHEKDHDHKKIIAKPNTGQSSNLVREGEKPNHEKDQDYKKPAIKPNIIAASASVWEGERPKHEKDHGHKKVMPMESSKHSRDNELLKSVGDTGVIVINTQIEEPKPIKNEDKKEPSAVIPIPKAKHCQVIDLTDPSDMNRKLKQEENRPFNLSKEILGSDLIKPTTSKEPYSDAKKLSNKHADLNVAPSFLSASSRVPTKSEGDDIQMVMENLKALQKLSSPIKADNPTGSPVSVIAYNRSFSPKSNSSQSSAGQRSDKSDFTGSFQDEFQKQFINSLQQMATGSNSNKSSYNRCS